jgi:hypothetical protein
MSSAFRSEQALFDAAEELRVHPRVFATLSWVLTSGNPILIAGTRLRIDLLQTLRLRDHPTRQAHVFVCACFRPREVSHSLDDPPAMAAAAAALANAELVCATELFRTNFDRMLAKCIDLCRAAMPGLSVSQQMDVFRVQITGVLANATSHHDANAACLVRFYALYPDVAAFLLALYCDNRRSEIDDEGDDICVAPDLTVGSQWGLGLTATEQVRTLRVTRDSVTLTSFSMTDADHVNPVLQLCLVRFVLGIAAHEASLTSAASAAELPRLIAANKTRYRAILD